MKVMHHIVCKGSHSLSTLLKSFQIRHEEVFLPSKSQEQNSLLTFDLDEEHATYPLVLHSLTADDMDIPHLEFDEDELLKSEWLTVRCTNSELDLANSELFFPYSTQPGGLGCKHVTWNQVYLSKPVRWRKKHFSSSYELGTSHMFCDDYAKKLLQEADASISFEIILHSKTKNILENAYYMKILDVLPSNAIVFSEREKKNTCDICGREYYSISSPGLFQLQVYKPFMQGRNCICRTPDCFALTPFFSEPINIISQELYRQLKAARATRNLVFRPVILAEYNGTGKKSRSGDSGTGDG